MLYACSIVLAFCSIVYELLLGQSLSAFLGNTVLRYSVTVGLYLLSLGIGARLSERVDHKNPILALLKIEFALTIIGGGCVALLFLISFLHLPSTLFSLCAHGLVVVIGVLTGFELPLLIGAKNNEKEGSENRLIGVNYLGAFIGTMAFALYFYPVEGLLPSSFTIGILNGVIGIMLSIYLLKRATESRRRGLTFLGAQIVLTTVLGFLLYRAHDVHQFLLINYLEG